MKDLHAMDPAHASFPIVIRPDAATNPDRPTERGAAEFLSTHGTFAAGFWESGPGEFRIDGYPVDELCVVLEGRIDIFGDGVDCKTFHAGDAFVVSKGFAGRWVLPTKTRKLFACAGPARIVTTMTGERT